MPREYRGATSHMEGAWTAQNGIFRNACLLGTAECVTLFEIGSLQM
jgi:hypothetical protein